MSSVSGLEMGFKPSSIATVDSIESSIVPPVQDTKVVVDSASTDLIDLCPDHCDGTSIDDWNPVAEIKKGIETKLDCLFLKAAYYNLPLEECHYNFLKEAHGESSTVLPLVCTMFPPVTTHFSSCVSVN